MDVSVFTQRGGTISSVRRSLLHGEFRASRSPDIIVVHVGTNDLERVFFHSNIEQYRQLLVSVRELFPLAKVVVDGILPRYDSESLDTSRIYHNIGLGTLCAKVGCHFIDFSGDFDEWAYARDGLHLGWDGNALFGELLQGFLEKMLKKHTCKKVSGVVPRELKKLVRHHRRVKKPDATSLPVSSQPSASTQLFVSTQPSPSPQPHASSLPSSNRASLNQHASSPVELFNSIEASTVFEHHSKFLSIIRRASWQGVYEDTLLPSDTALSFHWLRSCWVSQVWGSALQPIFEYPDLKMYGWHYENDSNKVDVVWDSPTNMESVRRNVLHLTRGCACAKSKCVNRQCKCKKDNKVCGPGCTCRNCENLPLSSINLFSHDSSDDDSISFSSVSDEEFTDEVSPILHTLTEPTDHPSSDSSLEYEYEDLP